MNFKKQIISLTCAILSCTLSSCALAQVTLVANGQSTFTVIVPDDAPASVQDAAQELQKDIELATGAKLPLEKDSATIRSPFISLGSTRQAKAANLSSEKLADEAFRIATQNGNLYILGPDTADGGWTKNNGVSNGTAHGVYTFLEDYLGVRWLMPGELGRDVPARSTLALDKIDRTETPQFSMRRVTHIWDYANESQYRNARAWADRQKLGGATDLNFNHNWLRTITGVSPSRGGGEHPAVQALYKAHPEWFAMDESGNRMAPEGKDVKFETTNPELVRWFADKAIAALKASDRPITYSLSPSDGPRNWSKSPESKALYDPNPSTAFDPESPLSGPSMSSLVMKWYHDIAQIVAREYPEGRLSGYLYSLYLYPPAKVSAKLPDNFTPMIAPSRNYGYGLYRKETQEYFKNVTDGWAKVISGDWFYYDLPNQVLRQQDAIGDANFPGSTGIITPAAPEILNAIFPQLQKSHIKGAEIYGVASWSNAALSNYILAKMEWDPTLNADDLQKEWLHRAYGLEAGAVMEQFYSALDGWYRDYFQQNESINYKLTLGMLKDIYAVHYGEMEKLLLQAKSRKMTAPQQQRLQLIEDNLIVLQWRLRNAGFLPANFASPLQVSDAQISALLTKDNPDFARFPGVLNSVVGGWHKPSPLPWKVQFVKGAPTVAAASTPSGLNDSQFLIYAAQDGDIRITPQQATHGAYFAAYELKDQAGELVTSGILDTATPIVFPAKAGNAYVLSIPSRKAANYQLQVENAAVATGDFRDGTLTLTGKPAPVYVFYAPGKAPVGVFEDDNVVKIRKPYSGAMAQTYMEQKFSDARLSVFDDGWRFSPDPKNNGLQRGVINADFDDRSWSPISPLDWWQMQGFPDYHGVAWYRLKFTAKPLQKGEAARLYFGAVDGNAVVYLNGQKIAEHLLEADFKGWDKPFTAIADRALQPGENTLVVQVTSKNDTNASGIFKGVAIVAGIRR